jgi:hypothetical protein
MLRRVALVKTDISEEPGASFIRVTKIGELGTTQAAISNRRTLRRNSQRTSVHRYLSPWWRRRQVPPKHRFLQEPHGVTSQKTPFFFYKVLSFLCSIEVAASQYNSLIRVGSHYGLWCSIASWTRRTFISRRIWAYDVHASIYVHLTYISKHMYTYKLSKSMHARKPNLANT